MDTARAIELYQRYKKANHDFSIGRHEMQIDSKMHPETEKLVQLADTSGWVLHDLNPVEANPKVVFVLDPWHEKYDGDLALFVNRLLREKELSKEDCLMLEGPEGELDFSYNVVRKNGQMYFGMIHKGKKRMLIQPTGSFTELVYDALKEHQIPVCYDDDDDVLRPATLIRASREIKQLEQSLRESFSSEKEKKLHENIQKIMEVMLYRSDNCFLKNILANSGRRIYQIFGLADYAIGNLQEKLSAEGISYAAFMPKEVKK